MGKLLPKNKNERESIIQKLAYDLAQKRGFAPNKEKEDWHEAEKILDQRIFGQTLVPNEIYGALMTKFYSSVELDISPNDLAIAFIKFIQSNKDHLKQIAAPNAENNLHNFRNISLLAQNTELSYLTKRSLFLADSTLLGHAFEPEIKYDWSSYTPEHIYEPVTSETHCYTNCPNFAELGSWLKACKGLLENGDLFYYPKTKIVSRSYDWHAPEEVSTNEDYLYDAVVSSRKIVEPITNDLWKTSLARVITQVEVPYLDHVDLIHFSKISCDEHHHLEVFRDHMREQFLDIFNNEGNESFDQNLQRIGINLRKGVRGLTSDMKSLNNTTALQTIGATIGTIAATLVAINSSLFDAWATVLGAGGGLAVFLKTVESHKEKQRLLENSPYYYLWLLEKS